MNPDVYVTMQGPSEYRIKGNANLKHWDVKKELPRLTIPTLSNGSSHDTMDPMQMEWIANTVQNGRYLHCPNGSHFAQFEDQEVCFKGLIEFIKDVDNKTS